MTVHHTATTDNDPDPAAAVRAIYRYHAVDQGFGDIGYQYLIDEFGIVYEGRWSGSASTSCGSAGGTGADFAHEEGTGLMVTGAHVGGWNSENLGVALLGDFTDRRRSGVDPKPAAVSSLEDLLAELAVRQDLDPRATVADGTRTTTGTAVPCTTTAGGTCTAPSALMPRATSSATCRTDAVTPPAPDCGPGRNTGRDGGPDGTTIAVTRTGRRSAPSPVRSLRAGRAGPPGGTGPGGGVRGRRCSRPARWSPATTRRA